MDAQTVFPVLLRRTRVPVGRPLCGERVGALPAPHRARGGKKLLAVAITLHGAQAREQEVVLDTTAQEKAITFPIDVKLHGKVIRTARRIAAQYSVPLRQPYPHRSVRNDFALPSA